MDALPSSASSSAPPALAAASLCDGIQDDGRPCSCRVSQEKLDQAFGTPKEKLYFKDDLCRKCGHDVASHASASVPVPTAPALSSSLSKKRKSLPIPRSGSEWTADYLSRLQIEFTPLEYSAENSAALDRCFWSGTASTLSDRAKEFLRRLEPLSVEAILFRRFPDDPTALLMHKYAALLTERGVDYDFQLTESTVDVFLVQLLTLLGFVDGPLVVISKNSLKFTMNGAKKVFATADVTVLNIKSGFRLVIAESKRKFDDSDSLEDFEAQLMAEAIAAGQANLKVERINEKNMRPKSAPSPGSTDPQTSAASSTAPPHLFLFCILVLGTTFLFYRANLQPEFLEGVADYEKLPEEGIRTEVFKIFNPQKTGVFTPSFDFCTAPDRAVIVEILDRMQQMIR